MAHDQQQRLPLPAKRSEAIKTNGGMFHPNETQMKNDLRDTLFQITRGKEKANNHGPNYPPNGNQDHNSAMAPANTQNMTRKDDQSLAYARNALGKIKLQLQPFAHDVTTGSLSNEPPYETSRTPSTNNGGHNSDHGGNFVGMTVSLAGGGGGGGSSNSSTTSSTSSSTRDPLHRVAAAYGTEDLPLRNQVGGKKTTLSSGLGLNKVIRKPSFEEKYRIGCAPSSSSPLAAAAAAAVSGASESSSPRSESPSVILRQGGVQNQRNYPPLNNGGAGSACATPPPVPPHRTTSAAKNATAQAKFSPGLSPGLSPYNGSTLSLASMPSSRTAGTNSMANKLQPASSMILPSQHQYSNNATSSVNVPIVTSAQRQFFTDSPTQASSCLSLNNYNNNINNNNNNNGFTRQNPTPTMTAAHSVADMTDQMRNYNLNGETSNQKYQGQQQQQQQQQRTMRQYPPDYNPDRQSGNKTQGPPVLQSAKSCPVQKPVPQTADAPIGPALSKRPPPVNTHSILAQRNIPASCPTGENRDTSLQSQQQQQQLQMDLYSSPIDPQIPQQQFHQPPRHHGSQYLTPELTDNKQPRKCPPQYGHANSMQQLNIVTKTNCNNNDNNSYNYMTRSQFSLNHFSENQLRDMDCGSQFNLDQQNYQSVSSSTSAIHQQQQQQPNSSQKVQIITVPWKQFNPGHPDDQSAQQSSSNSNNNAVQAGDITLTVKPNAGEPSQPALHLTQPLRLNLVGAPDGVTGFSPSVNSAHSNSTAPESAYHSDSQASSMPSSTNTSNFGPTSSSANGFNSSIPTDLTSSDLSSSPSSFQQHHPNHYQYNRLQNDDLQTKNNNIPHVSLGGQFGDPSGGVIELGSVNRNLQFQPALTSYGGVEASLGFPSHPASSHSPASVISSSSDYAPSSGYAPSCAGSFPPSLPNNHNYPPPDRPPPPPYPGIQGPSKLPSVSNADQKQHRPYQQQQQQQQQRRYHPETLNAMSPPSDVPSDSGRESLMEDLLYSSVVNLAGIGDIGRAKSNSSTTSSRPASCDVDLLLRGSSSRDAPRRNSAHDILSQISCCDAGSGGREGDSSSTGTSVTAERRRGEESGDGSRKRSSTLEGRSSTTDDVESISSASSTGKNNFCLGKEAIPCSKAQICDKERSAVRHKNRSSRIKNLSPQAYRFYMEQHVENVIKSAKERDKRRMQLEEEMEKAGLNDEAQAQMRKLLTQKESNYIRLRRARMDRNHFHKIKTLGVGAFGEVALVNKKDNEKHYYAMKTLCKADVLMRNQIAHVKAERDILAEADTEWVVKLYYSFQDDKSLYFVMDYVPGGDMMALLIKKGIFEEQLAQFYIAELTLALQSVHELGFIHRDIKPDNILIDKDGHIKLTDFGLCTGFRWTHSSKYYQPSIAERHPRQDSMDPSTWDVGDADHAASAPCSCGTLGNSCRPSAKPLERRRMRLRQHQRCLAHSLVGTPNYIAPEVLLRSGYKQSCDWWSVGVILFEMLVGQPPFLANTPAETQHKVVHWDNYLHIPPEARLTQAAENLILRFCCDQSDRLGAEGADQVKQHPFFHGVDFMHLRQTTPPHVPVIKHETDTSNFDPVEPERDHVDGDSSDDDAGDNPSKEKSRLNPGNAQGEHAFLEFTFRRFFDDNGVSPPRIVPTNNPDSSGPIYV